MLIALMKSLPLPQSHCLCFFHELASVIRSQYCRLLKDRLGLMVSGDFLIVFHKRLLLVSPTMCGSQIFALAYIFGCILCVAVHIALICIACC